MHKFGTESVAVAALRPQTITGSTDVAGIEIDTSAITGIMNAQTAKMICEVGAKGGTAAPTSLTVTFRLTDCATSGGSFTNVTSSELVSSSGSVQATDQNQIKEFNINLAGCKRYVKVVALPAFTGGTDPAVLVSAALVVSNPQLI